jgi:hypothetical protein
MAETMELKAKVDFLEKRAAIAEETHNDALRRQIAINLEYEIKLDCLELVWSFWTRPW